MKSEQENDIPPFTQSEIYPSNFELYLDTIFNNSVDPLFIKDEECRLLLVNDAFCDLFDLPKERIIGKTLAEQVLPQEREHFLGIDRQVLKDGKEILCEETLTTSSKQTKIILTRKNRFVDPQGNYFLVGTIQDITENKQTQIREKSRTRVLELINEGGSLPVILEAIILAVEQENPDMLCSILLLDETKTHLLIGAGPSLPDFYNDAIHGVEIGMGVGSCGTAAFINERVIVDDIQTHSFWRDYKDIAGKAGLGSCWSEPIRATDGEVLGTFAIYHREINLPSEADHKVIDQTASLVSIAIEKKQAEEKLKRGASVFTHAQEGIIITDANAVIIEVNEAFSLITGYDAHEVLGKNPNILQSGLQSESFFQQMWDALTKQGHWRGEIWNRRKNGDIYPEMLTINAVKNAAGDVDHYVSLCTDITSMKEHQSQLERIAHYDLLTNLPNRVLLADRLSQAMLKCTRQKESLAVVFLDLDGFKKVNDSYGHNIGDELLVAISLQMKNALREDDSLARIGGDEFVAVLTGLSSNEDYEPVLERLLLAASRPIMIGENVLNVSASIGVTLYPQDNVDADQLMRHADQAMYIAKESGKNHYHVFDTAQDGAVKVQREGLDAIRNALQTNQFVLHYQPKVNMRTGEVTGVEALIRWQHPQRGLLNPIEFLPVIENNPLSIEIGEWVINTTLAQITQWQQSGLIFSGSVSVNISAIQLQQSDFTERLTTFLAAHPEVEPSCLRLEILETSAWC